MFVVLYIKVVVIMNIIVDFRMDNEIRETLAAMGFELYNSYDLSQLYEGLR